MNTIYLVALGTCIADVLEGFATNEEEIRQIVINDWADRFYIDGVEVAVEVDLEDGTVTAKGDWDTTYYIHAIRRVEG